MSNAIKGVLIFGAGAFAGSICTIRVMKDKLKEEIELEIAEMRAYYREKMKESKAEETITKEEFKPIEEVIEEEDKAEKIIQDKGYVNYSKYMDDTEKENEANPWDIPYVIDEEEYGTIEDYDTEVLTYFADKVLVDEVDEIIEDVDTVVGLDNLSIFEEFEGARILYIRSELYKTDFMICKDDWKYSDLSDYPKTEKKPHQL